MRKKVLFLLISMLFVYGAVNAGRFSTILKRVAEELNLVYEDAKIDIKIQIELSDEFTATVYEGGAIKLVQKSNRFSDKPDQEIWIGNSVGKQLLEILKVIHEEEEK